MLQSRAGRFAIGSDGQTLDRRFPIRAQPDVTVARAQAQRMARACGLPVRRAAELAIVVSELGTNIVKYGVRGEIRFTVGSGDSRASLPSARPPLLVIEPPVPRDAPAPIGAIRIVASDEGLDGLRGAA